MFSRAFGHDIAGEKSSPPSQARPLCFTFPDLVFFLLEGSSLPSPGKTSSSKVHANSLAARPVFVFDVKEERELNHESQPTGCVQGLRDEEEHSMASVAGARSMGAGQRPAPHRLWILPDTVGEMEGLKRGVVEWGL